jgi:2-polyprenyl-3-methyl-5-hydroxy-6-metoxy-1,4-benzoquinol methylase
MKDRRNFLDTAQVAKFWDQARKAAESHQQTGYLQDEWPAALGANRLRGEWNQVARWLEQYDVPRGACLDVGCGSGVWLQRLAPLFERAEGIDLSSEMVRSAQLHLEHCGVGNVTVTCQSALELSEDRCYDLIFVGGVLMYLNDDVVAGMLAKLRRMLTPRGLLILRESTCFPDPWYRDTPLLPGLFADPHRASARAPYFAIYRTPETYRTLARGEALVVKLEQDNRDYKLADMTESLLRLLNRLRRGDLTRRRDVAERAAEWIYRLRWILLIPSYHVIHMVAPRTWKITNRWYLCGTAPKSSVRPSTPLAELAPGCAEPAAGSS